MSVGHVARLLEEAGIPTVIVAVRAFQDRLTAMKVPRLVSTPYPMGRPLGAPGDGSGQRAVLRTALELLGTASQPGAVIRFEGSYRPLRR